VSNDPSEIIQYSDLLLKKTFITIVKMVVLLNIFVKTVIRCFPDSLMNRKLKRTAFISRNLL